MATGLFHRHARDGRSADDQAAAERAADADRARPGLAGRVMGRRPPLASGQPVPPGGAVAPLPEPTPSGTTDRTYSDRTDTTERIPAEQIDRAQIDRVEAERDQAERDRAEAEREAEAARRLARRAHTSFAATLSLVIGVCAVLAALSGRLAPVAVGLGVLGLLVAGVGFAAVARRQVTGHHVAILGLLFSIVGVVFGILAINKSVPWLNGDVDQASRLRDWLDSQWSWLKRW
jgi:hypothetical protein